MSLLRVQYFQHVHFESLAGITPWLDVNGCTVRGTEFHKGEEAPDPSGFDWLIIMGGPMSATDDRKYSWMAKEKRCIERTIRDGKTVLGICLGAQLMADVLGARVYPHSEREIGWFPVQLTEHGRRSGWFGDRDVLTPFHWHGETFDIPSGAEHLAYSEGCLNQAFSAGPNLLGLQFHIDTTPESIRLMLTYSSADLVPGRYVQDADEMTSGNLPSLNRLPETMASILGSLRANARLASVSRG